MRIGALRHRIDIERDANAGADPPVTDAHGQPVEDWQVWTPGWPARVTPLAGRERFAAQQVNAETTHTVEIRYLAGLRSTDRIRFNGRILTIDGVQDIDELNLEMHVACTERPNG